MSPECQRMHIDRANEITMSRESTDTACPISAFGLVFVPTARTLATCSSFGASEARDVGLFGFMSEIVDVFAIFPQGHALIVMPAIIPIAHAVGIANEETSHLILNAKVDDLSSSFIPSLFVSLHAEVPDLGRLLLRGFQSVKLASRQVFKSIHSYGFHAIIIAWTSQKKENFWGHPRPRQGGFAPCTPKKCQGQRAGLPAPAR